MSVGNLDDKLIAEARRGAENDRVVIWQFLDGSDRRLLLQLFAPEEKETCDYCGQVVHPVDDFVERATARVLEMRGKVEQVRGAAAEKLQEVGNIGALLRF